MSRMSAHAVKHFTREDSVQSSRGNTSTSLTNCSKVLYFKNVALRKSPSEQLQSQCQLRPTSESKTVTCAEHTDSQFLLAEACRALFHLGLREKSTLSLLPMEHFYF